MSRKKKVVLIDSVIAEPNPYMKNVGIFMAIMGFLSTISLIPEMHIEHIKENVGAFIIILSLLFFVFMIMPYWAITTKKRLIIKGDKFIIKSNKKKYKVSVDLEDMIWWRKTSYELMEEIELKLPNQSIRVNGLEFKNFWKINQFFKRNFKEKEKKL